MLICFWSMLYACLVSTCYTLGCLTNALRRQSCMSDKQLHGDQVTVIGLNRCLFTVASLNWHHFTETIGFACSSILYLIRFQREAQQQHKRTYINLCFMVILRGFITRIKPKSLSVTCSLPLHCHQVAWAKVHFKIYWYFHIEFMKAILKLTTSCCAFKMQHYNCPSTSICTICWGENVFDVP